MAAQMQIQYVSDAEGHPVSVLVPIELWREIESKRRLLEDDSRGGAQENAALQAKFDALVKQWRQETATLSSTTKIVTHPAYQRIMAMGEKAVPFILRELQKEPDHWFYALRNITEASPVSPEDVGDIQKMAAAWIKWGIEHHYID